MIIKCICDTGIRIQGSSLAPKNYDVDINKYYVVYGMTLISNYIHYYINDPSGISYPWEYPGFLFEVVDGRFSKYWNFRFFYEPEPLRYDTIWAYSEWAQDNFHYGSLVDGDENAMQIYRKHKDLMELEFPNPSIELSAEALDDEWLFCKDCIDAWQSTTDDGMVICPKCKKMMHNPRHTSILNIS